MPTPPAKNPAPPTGGGPSPTVTISAPAMGNTVSQNFTISGTYDTNGGALQKIECQLLVAGTTTPAEPAVLAAVVPGRPVWTATLTTTKTGTFDIVVRIHLTTGEFDEQGVAGVVIEATPMVGIVAPLDGVEPGATNVGVQVSFKPGHNINRIDVELLDSNNSWESQTTSKISLGHVSWGPVNLSGFASEDHRVRVVAQKQGGGGSITLSVGAIKLS